MADERNKDERQAASRGANSRQDRLKSALRENLKRRKAQERERRNIADIPSGHDEASPDGELGKRAD